MSLYLQCVGETHVSLHSKRFSKWGLSPGSVFPRIQLIWCLVIVSLCMCIYTQDFQLRVHPGPLHLLLCAYVCIWRKSVNESASGTWSRMVAWEQISCSCVYLVLTVHTGLFFHCPWAYQHVVSLLRWLYLPASGLKMWRQTIYKTWLESESFWNEMNDEMWWKASYDFLYVILHYHAGIPEYKFS